MRNTTAVKTAFLAIRKGQPDAVVLVGAYKPGADFIRLARRHGLNALFVNISFVGSTALAKELWDDDKDVIISQVVPLPDDRSIPVVSRYRAALLSTFQHAVDTDVVAREVVEPGQPALAGVVAAFGPGVLGADGCLDRRRQLVFPHDGDV